MHTPLWPWQEDKNPGRDCVFEVIETVVNNHIKRHLTTDHVLVADGVVKRSTMNMRSMKSGHVPDDPVPNAVIARSRSSSSSSCPSCLTMFGPESQPPAAPPAPLVAAAPTVPIVATHGTNWCKDNVALQWPINGNVQRINGG
jgi:hypothetical protein